MIPASGRLGLRFLLASAVASAGCGRSIHHQAADTAGESGAGTVGGAGGTTGGSGGSGGTGGTGAWAGMAEKIPSAEPFTARHAVVGAPQAQGCLSSVAQTATGIRFGGQRNPTPFVGTGEAATDAGWVFEVESRDDSSGSAFVFGDASGQVVVWPGPTPVGMSFEFFDASGALVATHDSGQTGEPLAARGTATEFSLVFSGFDDLWLYEYRDGNGAAFNVEQGGCLEPYSLALGTFEGDTVLAYVCGGVFVARLHAATGEVEKTKVALPVELDTSGTSADTSVPGVSWHDDEFLVAYQGADGVTIAHISPDDPSPRNQIITGVPPAYGGQGRNSPLFSLIQVGDEIALTRSTCNGHEDASPTGAFNLCRIPTDSWEAVCSDVDAPCESAKLVAYGSEAALIGCDGASPSFMPLDLALIPAEQPAFSPAGYATFDPLALTCDGEHCDVLVGTNEAGVANREDERLAFADLTLDGACAETPCEASAPVPTSVFSAGNADLYYQPSITVERQLTGLPLGVVTTSLAPDGASAQALLSLLEPSGVVWEQPVGTSTKAALFRQGDGFFGLSSDSSSGTLYPFTVSQAGLVTFPAVAASFGSGPELPSLAYCGGRVLALGWANGSTLAQAAVFAIDPSTAELATLFDPRLTPRDSSAPRRELGCAGERVVILDGFTVHQYSITGERGPDVALATQPATVTGGTVFIKLETREHQVLVASASSLTNVLEVLLFDADGSNSAFGLPLAPGAVPLVSLAVAPDLGDGWLRILYQSGNETSHVQGRGNVFASAFELSGP